MQSLQLLLTLTVSTCSLLLILSALLSVPSVITIVSTTWTQSRTGYALSRIRLLQHSKSCRSSSLSEDGCDIRDRLKSVFPYDRFDHSRIPNFIWQTSKYTSELYQQDSWSKLHPDHIRTIANNAQADGLIKTLYARIPEIHQAYSSMPLDIHRADYFRYLVLFAEGGTYSDIDTDALKPVQDWKFPSNTTRNSTEDDQEPGLIVGIEADPDSPNWADWYARRLQICQWTIRSKPGHPVLADIIARIAQETLRMKKLGTLTPKSLNISTMEYTGPGIWTDAVFSYLNSPVYFTKADKLDNPTLRLGDNVTAIDFTNQTQPRLVGDVLILPVTSFSPGMGRGAKNENDPLAFVKHHFQGSWKSSEKVKGSGVGE